MKYKKSCLFTKHCLNYPYDPHKWLNANSKFFYPGDIVEEISVHNKVVELGQRHLLKHPLMGIFLHVKWFFMRKMFYLHLILYVMFLAR